MDFVDAASLDGETLEAFQAKRVWFSSVRELLTVAVRVIFACEPSEISMLYFLWFVRCAGSMEQLIDSRNGGQDTKIDGGTYQLCTKLAERLGGRIALNSVVRKVEQSAKSVIVTTENGVQHTSRYLVVAIPPHLGVEIQFAPILPRKRTVLMQHMQPGKSTETASFGILDD